MDMRVLSAEEWHHHVRVHGILMTLGWGFFLPAAVACFRLLRHRNHHPSYKIFRLHYILAFIGTILAIVGWVVALQNFHVLQHGPRRDPESGQTLAWTGPNIYYAHAFVGTVVMCGACFNVLVYGIMSKPKHETETFEEYTLLRKIGHVSHMVLGYLWIILGLVVCGTGTRMTGSDVENAQFVKGLVASFAAVLVILALALRDKLQHDRNSQPSDQPLDESSALLPPP